MGTARRISALAIPALALLLVVGCARTLPQEVSDVNRELSRAKDDCASVYAAGELADVQSGVDSMNGLADDKKYKKARREAEPLLPQVQQLATTAQRARDEAKDRADAAVQAASNEVDAARSAEVETYAASEYGDARSKLDEARRLADDPCKYREAATAAEDAVRLAGAASAAAVAEKRRQDEERRLAEERRRKEEEEARRRAEEERLRRFPPTWTVERGDSLWRLAGMERIYDNPVYWPILWEANEDAVSDPDLIYPGQEIQIPRGLSEEQMEDKLKALWRRLGSGTEE